ncbi:hypothetical protein ACFLX9_02895 [Chloroflexota bacterium]
MKPTRDNVYSATTKAGRGVKRGLNTKPTVLALVAGAGKREEMLTPTLA